MIIIKKENVPVFPILIGSLLGFLFALLLEWLAINLLANVENAFSIIVGIYFVLIFVFLILGLYLLHAKHIMSGMCFLVCALKLLNWILQWYLPIFTSEGWMSLDWVWHW